MHSAVSKENKNKALIRRWFEEVWNEGRVELVDELRAPDTVAMGLGEGQTKSHGNSPFKVFYSNMRQTFPDLHVKIEDMLAEGEKVAVRATFEGTHMGDALGAAPTGRTVTFACIAIARIANGRIVEAWNSLDQLGILQQIGALQGTGLASKFLTQRS